MKFKDWLYKKICENNRSVTSISKHVQIDKKIIFRHLDGQKPKYIQVVTYCWYFDKCSTNPDYIWEMVEEEFN